MYINASDLVRFDIKPFLLGILFSRIMPIKNIPETFYVYTNFRVSKAVNYTDFDFIKYSEKLVRKYNEFSGYENWKIQSAKKGSMELRFYIKNDLNIGTSEFYNLIYKKTMQEDFMFTQELTLDKRLFLIGFMETRGSIDLNRPYISQDYFYDNTFELKRIQLITDHMNIPYGYVNFNPRNLQDDYVSGRRKRNTQFRINIHYYSRLIGYINEYKALVYEKAWRANTKRFKDNIITYDVSLPNIKDSVAFIKYLNFFTNNIYKKELNKEKIESLREMLGFNKDGNDFSTSNRNKTIIELFDSLYPDKCALCQTEKTFTKKNGRQAFEIHHIIPFHNGKQYDNIANLVKLCPTCHSSLKKGRATKKTQVENIISLLHEHHEIYEYASSTLGINNINDLAEQVFMMLG